LLLERVRATLPRRPGFGGEEHDSAGLGLLVPALDLWNGRAIPDQDRVHPFAEQPLREFRILATGPQEFAQRPQDSPVKALASGNQRGCARRQAHPVALQLLERIAPGCNLRDGLLATSPLGSRERLALTRFGHPVAGPLIFRCRRPMSLQQPVGIGGGDLVSVPGTSQLLLQAVPERRRLRRLLAKPGEVRFEGAPLPFERAEGLGLPLEILLEATDGGALIGQPQADALLGRGPAQQLGLDLVILSLRRVTLLRGRVALPHRDLGPRFHLPALSTARTLRAEAFASRSAARLRSPSRRPSSTCTCPSRRAMSVRCASDVPRDRAASSRACSAAARSSRC
jgi:hypothetical protein